MSWTSHIGAAFALGFALGAAPGPVQLLLLTETAKRGFSGGLRVMLGANGTLFLVMVALAFGFSSLAPGESLLRALRVVGGGFLIYLAVDELLRGSVARRSTPTTAVTEAPPTHGPDAARRRLRDPEPRRLDLLRHDGFRGDRRRHRRRAARTPRWRPRSS